MYKRSRAAFLATSLVVAIVQPIFAQANPPEQRSLDDFDALSRRAQAAVQTDPKQAIALYQQALSIRPSWAEGWFYLAAAFYGAKRYTESRKAFERAGALAPNDGSVWGFLGLCEYELGDYPEALSHIQKGEALGFPDNLDFVSTVRNRAALICIRSSNFAEAIDQLRPLARVGDNSHATIQALGVSALEMPHLPTDVPADKQGLVEAAGRAAWALYAERAVDAKASFQELLAAYPQQPGVHYLYGLFLLSQDPDAARAEFRKELQLTPSHVSARLQIAILDIRSGNPQLALEPAREAVKLDTKNPLARAVLGRALLDLNQPAKAIPELMAAARLDPRNAQMHLYLEQAYHRVGRTEDAEREKAEFLRMKSEQRQ